MKKIGIIGSGIVGKKLAEGFLKHGYEVKIGSSNPSKLEDWVNSNAQGVDVASFEEVAEFGEICVLAVKGTAAEKVVKSLADKLKSKIVIDATNPIEEAPPVNGVLKFFTSLDRSLMEELQDIAPEAHFVKAFNSVGSAHMVNPSFPSSPSMFIAGNEDKAKKEVEEILKKFGWETVDMGKVESARAIEPLCMLWCIPGFLNGEWSHAFKLLK